ncbi:uncharacterized protein [Miscanthus floridulus]|uniref:uncharacterized protein n=1 Tax=Miscanthus floridulus TaxID=154761 RepID=UPI003459BDEB
MADTKSKASGSGKTPPRSPSRSRSPTRRSRTRRRSRTPRREGIVERVVRETTRSGNWPQLTKTNYDSWSLLMKLKMQSRYLWDAIEDEDVDYHADRSTLEAICSGVSQEMVPTLATKASAKEAWEAIRTMRIGDDRRLAILGDLEPESKVVAKYLRVARPRYKQLVISIETLLDINELTIEEVTGRLKVADEGHDTGGGAGSSTARLNHTKDELVERVVSRLQVSGGGGSGGGRPPAANQRRGRGGGSSQGGGSSGGSKPPTGGNGKKKKKLAGDECAYCGKTGHWAREYRQKKRDELARAAKAEAEGTLLMGITSIYVDAVPTQARAEPVDAQEETVRVQIGGGDASARWVFPDKASNTVDTMALVVLATPSDAASSTVANKEVHIREDKLFVQLREKRGDGRTRWILDTGATNHMTEERSVFSNLDKGVDGTVRFGDGLVIDIEGRNTILFSCKNGEHQKFASMYLIPKLTANIISLGQLDKDRYKILIEEGLMRIWDPRRCLLARVERAENRLYTLDLNISTPVCLVAHGDDVAWKWHKRYGHLGFHGLKLLSKKEMVRGLPAIDHVEQLCESCLTRKQRRHSFPAVNKFHATRSLELVYADLCGPIMPSTPGGQVPVPPRR